MDPLNISKAHIVSNILHNFPISSVLASIPPTMNKFIIWSQSSREQLHKEKISIIIYALGRVLHAPHFFSPRKNKGLRGCSRIERRGQEPELITS